MHRLSYLLTGLLRWGILIGWSYGGAALAALPSVSLSSTLVSCPGGNDGSASAIVSNLNPSFTYTYLWSTGASGPLNGSAPPPILGLSAGVYVLTITELQTGYQFFDFVVVSEPAPLTLTATLTDVSCHGQANGAIDLTVSGGTPPLNHQWTDPQGNVLGNAADLVGISAGTYQVAVSDANGCTASRGFVITQPLAPLSVQANGQDLSCFLANDGSVSATAFGGTPPYAFDWNNGQHSTPQVNGLSAGTYALVVSDANGCTATASVGLTQPNALQLTGSINDALCADSASGFIDLTVSGGSGGYQYQWTNSQVIMGSQEDLGPVPADAYAVTVSDGNGCQTTGTFTVSEPAPVAVAAAITAVACAGQNSGAIDLTVSGGTPGYQFDWTSPAGTSLPDTASLANLAAGTYSVRITDGNGCTRPEAYVVAEPAIPLSATAAVTDVACHGEASGSLDLSLQGGTPPYQVLWNNGQSGLSLSQLPAGSYSATVSDSNGCLTTPTYVIAEPAAPLRASAQLRHVGCYGQRDGVIDLTPTGGTAPYQFAWSNTRYALSRDSEDLDSLVADAYRLRLTDANGCVWRDTLTISQPPPLTLTFDATDIHCHGEATGRIDLAIEGGVQPYAVSWNTGAASEDLASLPAGTYGVTVRDANQCLRRDSIRLREPAAPLSGQAALTAVRCPDGQDGRIACEAQGGTPPYQYQWSTGAQTPTVGSLPAGRYALTITDEAGCTWQDTLALSQPDAFVLSADIEPVSCADARDGRIDLRVTGGTAPYRYRWADPRFVLYGEAADLRNAPGGRYTVAVTDSLGCRTQRTFDLAEPAPLDLTLTVQAIICQGDHNGGLSLEVQGGTAPYEVLWRHGATDRTLRDLSAGRYEVTVFDRRGCVAEDSAYLPDPAAIRIEATISPASCIDQIDGQIALNVRGGRRPYQLEWADGERGARAQGLSVGTYPLRLIDATGCQVDTVFAVGHLEQPCLDIPNAFTPNGDGVNDEWRIADLAQYPEAVLSIFTQWGKRIFAMRPGDDWWDGTYQGKPLPAATYYYTLEVRDDRAPYSGSITLVR